MKRFIVQFGIILLSFTFGNVNGQTFPPIDAFGVDSLGFNCMNSSPAYYRIELTTYGYNKNDSIDVIVNFGDGTIINRRYEFTIYRSNGSNPNYGFVRNYVQHTYAAPGNYQIQLIAITPDNKRDTFIDTTGIYVTTCGNLSGDVYFDLNNDCVFNSGDDPYSKRTVHITDNNTKKVYYTVTDSNGYYEIDLPNGTSYSVDIIQSYYNVVCPTGGHTNVNVPNTSIDLGIDCGTGFDLYGMMSGGYFRPGRNTFFTVKPINPNCTQVSGKLKIVLNDPRISFHSMIYGNPPIISGDTLIFDFNNINYLNYLNIGNPATRIFNIHTNTTAKINDLICMEVITEPLSGDIDPSNNVKTYCYRVRNSFDPNDKSAYPLGLGEEALIESGTRLEYNIRFQNTGNDVAYDVFILDTLSANLDINSIEIQGTSHQMDWQIINGNILKFNFDNINLPDSNTNEPESHGFVNFSIKSQDDLEMGTKIFNKAAIYFDFNEPIITNEVERTIGILTGIENSINQKSTINLFPNPTNGLLNIDLSNSQTKLNVRNTVGQVLKSQKLISGKNIVNLNELPKGMYLLEFETNGEIDVQKVIVY